jgi:cellulose synthase/poly-beta-1,6-N-acetylglucosamine synthase-like glycosyltransferase
MNNTIVSVITVVKNGGRYLAEAIKSILSQTYKSYEIIVIDGQSTDNTEKIAKSFPQVRYIRQSSQGLANARNTGIEAAEGELIAFLDHDDLWAQNKLSTQVQHLVNHPVSQYTITWMKFFLEPGCSLRPGFKPASLEHAQIGYTPSALVARKSLLPLIGQFNPDFTIGCDVDWFKRARSSYISMAVIPGVLLYKRIHNTNLSSNVQVNKRELFAIVKQSIEHQRHQKNTNK